MRWQHHLLASGANYQMEISDLAKMKIILWKSQLKIDENRRGGLWKYFEIAQFNIVLRKQNNEIRIGKRKNDGCQSPIYRCLSSFSCLTLHNLKQLTFIYGNVIQLSRVTLWKHISNVNSTLERKVYNISLIF